MPEIKSVGVFVHIEVEGQPLKEHVDHRFDKWNLGANDERPGEPLLVPKVRRDDAAIRDNPYGQAPGQYGYIPRTIMDAKFIQAPRKASGFGIRVGFTSAFKFKGYDQLVQFDFDGSYGSSFIVNRKELVKDRDRWSTVKRKGTRQGPDGETVEYNFEFSRIRILEQDPNDDSPPNSYIGSVRVRIWRVSKEGVVKGSRASGKGGRNGDANGFAGSKNIPENRLKKGAAITHGTRMGRMRRKFIPRVMYNAVDGIKSKDRYEKLGKPYVDFLFKVRSRNSLQLLGIIPGKPRGTGPMVRKKIRRVVPGGPGATIDLTTEITEWDFDDKYEDWDGEVEFSTKTDGHGRPAPGMPEAPIVIKDNSPYPEPRNPDAAFLRGSCGPTFAQHPVVHNVEDSDWEWIDDKDEDLFVRDDDGQRSAPGQRASASGSGSGKKKFRMPIRMRDEKEEMPDA